MAKHDHTCPCGSGKVFPECCGRPAGRAQKVSPGRFPGAGLRFKVTLKHTHPKVWRRFRIPRDGAFLDLHHAIQTLGWTDSHLWEFSTGSRGTRRVLAASPDDEPMFGARPPAAEDVPLAGFFRKAGDRCLYTYDFGDNWEHDVELEGIELADPERPWLLLGGAEGFPPEDCGGIPGYERLRTFHKTGADPLGEDEDYGEWAADMAPRGFDLEQEREMFAMAGRTGPAGRKADGDGETPSARDQLLEQMLAANLGPLHPERIDEHLMDVVIDGLRECCQELSADLNLDIRLGKGSYNHINGKLAIEIAIIRPDGVVMNKQAEDFEDRAGEFGLDPGDLGKILDVNGHQLQIVGLRPRAKSPVVCRDVKPGTDHTRLVAVSAEAVRRLLP